MAKQESRTKRKVTATESTLQFPSERLLIEAVASLLTRLPWGITGVQMLHGPREGGKDIVFTQQGAFGESVLCACVIKNSKLTGAVTGVSGTITVVHQVKQALKIPYLNDAGERVLVKRVYVITPYSLSVEARSSVEDQIPSSVQFIGGPQLFDLFRSYWKDFLVEEFDRRLKQAQESLNRDEALVNVASSYRTGIVDRTVRDVYVEPTFFRTFSEYEIEDDLTSFLDFDDLRRKTERNASVLTGSTELLIPARPARWLINAREIQERRIRFRHSRPAFEKFEELLVLPPKHRTVPKILDLLDELNRLHAGSSPESRGQNQLFSRRAGSRPTPGEITLREYEALKERASYLSRELKRTVTILQEKLNQTTLAAKKGLDSLAAVTAPWCVQASLYDRAFAGLPASIVNRKTVTPFTIPGNLRDAPRLLLITAPAGYGKTSFCRWHALEDIEHYNSRESPLRPIYIPLYKIRDSALTNVQTAFLNTSAHSLLRAPKRRTDKSLDNAVRLYLDGLDEVASTSIRSRIVELAQEAMESYPHLQVIITARDYAAGPYMHQIPFVSLGELSEDQSGELVRRWLTADQARRFFKQLRSVHGLEVLLKTPLMATLAVLVFKQTGNLPASKVMLYDTVVDLMVSGWDLAKGVNRGSRISNPIKWAIIRSIAWQAHYQKRREFSADFVSREVFRWPIGNIGSHETIDELLSDGIIGGASDLYQFSHLSIQEYLAAKDVLGDPRGKRLNWMLGQYLQGDDWWKEVIGFYIALAGRVEEIKAWVDQGEKIAKRSAPGWLVVERVEYLHKVAEAKRESLLLA